MSNNKIKKSTIESVLKEKGEFIGSPLGISMLPMIREGKDTVHIKSQNTNFRKFDVILYKRNSGKYVLHRILKVRDNDYVLCGDNQTTKEYGITDKNILGILKGFYKKEKYISCNNKNYKIYVKLWCSNIYLRKPILFCKRVFLKIRRVLNEKNTI